MIDNIGAPVLGTIYADQDTTPTILQFNANKQLGNAATLHELLHFMTMSNSHFALIQEPGISVAALPSTLKILKSGRTAILYHGTYPARLIPEGTVSSPPLDSIEVEFYLPDKTSFRLCSFYRPPSINNILTPSAPLLDYLKTHLNTPQNIILGGDCNIHLTSLGSATNHPPLASRALKNFIQAMDSGGCMNDGRTTRIGAAAALKLPQPSAIDITLWNSDDANLFSPSTWTPGPQLKSDHRTILIGAPFLNKKALWTAPPHPNRRKYIQNRQLTDYPEALENFPKRFTHHFTEAKLHEHPIITGNHLVASNEDIDQLNLQLTTVIQLAAADTGLIKLTSTRTNPPRLRHYNWTTECSQAKKIRDKALRKLRRKKRLTQDPLIIVPLIRVYRDHCQTLRTIIQKTKRDSWKSTCSTLSYSTPTGHIWKHFKRLSRTSKNSSNALPTIYSTTRPPSTHPHDQATTLAKHFQSISSRKNHPPEANFDHNHFDAINNNTILPDKPQPPCSPQTNDPITDAQTSSTPSPI